MNCSACRERDAVIAIQQEQIDAQQEQLEALAKDVQLLKRALYGHRRERFDDPHQGTLFDSEWTGSPKDEEPLDEEALDNPSAVDDDDSTSTPRRGGHRGRIVIPEAMPRKEVVHPLREEDLPEHLRGRDDLRRFRKKVGQYIEIVEASGYVVEEFVEVLAADHDDSTETEMVHAPRPPRILNSYAGSSLLASFVVDRFADYLPYYRLEERSTAWG